MHYITLMSTIKDLIDMGILDADFAEVKGVVPDDPASNPSSPVSHNDSVWVGSREREHEHVFSHEPRFTHNNTYNRQHQSHDDIDEPEDELFSSSDEVEDENYSYFKQVKYHWLYSSKSAGWWHFDQKDNEKLERKYQSGRDVTKLVIGGNRFVINFSDMSQRLGSNSRNILRIETLKDIYLRGIGGAIITKDKLINDDRELSE